MLSNVQDVFSVKLPTAKSIAWLLCSAAVWIGGCRRPAYQDLYVQNMAAEIRDLEDIIYDYDHEYRKLELELEASKRENELLKKMGINPKNQSILGPSGSTPSPSDKNWQGRSPSDTPENPPPANLEPLPSMNLKDDASSTPLKSLQAEPSEPLKLEPTPAAPADPAIEKSLPTPPSAILPPPATSGPAPKSVDPGLMEPPAIDLGTPTEELPPDLNKKPGVESGKIPGGSTNPAPLLPPPTLGALEVELGRIPKSANVRRRATRLTDPQSLVIDQPISQASYATPSSQAQSNLAQSNLAIDRRREDSPLPLDQRLTEISFVRPFSIALDLDGQPGDDAVRLVLQPRNAAGEFIPHPAELVVSIINPELEDESARLGMWKFTPQQVEQAIRKQGNAKGIHIDLQLEGNVPAGKKVLVFVRYQTADGRRLESSYEYILSTPGDLESKWLPRAGSSSRSARGSGG
jgi:hypothetical protein